jgi:catechol 2,3-dioxygenase-like lactoylglutathione lyase family enzyme
MRRGSLVPTIGTERLAETRAFYERLGFSAVADDGRGLRLRHPGGIEIAFVKPQRGPRPTRNPAFRGHGLTLDLEVESADREYDRAMLQGVAVAEKLRDEPDGRRRFAVVDPNGVVLAFVQQLSDEGCGVDSETAMV